MFHRFAEPGFHIDPRQAPRLRQRKLSIIGGGASISFVKGPAMNVKVAPTRGFQTVVLAW